MFSHSFVRFLIVGVINTCIGLSCMYIALDLFHFNYWYATIFGNVVGAIVSYFLNRKFTFKSNGVVWKSAIRFTLVIAFCYFVSYKAGITLATLGLGHWPILPEKYISEVAVLLGSIFYTLTNYFGQKFLVFNKQTQTRSMN